MCGCLWSTFLPEKLSQGKRKKTVARGDVRPNIWLLCAANQQRSSERGQCGSAGRSVWVSEKRSALSKQFGLEDGQSWRAPGGEIVGWPAFQFCIL